MASKRTGKNDNNSHTIASAHAINEDLGRRVKKLRGSFAWSLEQLASASGVSRSMLSEIERERANPTLSVTYRIARAFGLSLQDLLENNDPTLAIQTIRVTDQEQIFRKDKQCQIRTLSPLNLERDIEFYEVILAPGGTLRSQPHVAGTREFLTVKEGKVELSSGHSSDTLNKGDSATYRADLKHSVVNNGSNEATLFIVVIYRS
jgi:transcriptional regulator with XRE-family HTH domain